MIVERYTNGKVEGAILTNARGSFADWLGYGATLVRLAIADAAGRPRDVVAGLPATMDHLGPHPYVGATVGRFANRIAGACFPLDGVVHHVAANEGRHQLHGGPLGFSRREWEIDADDLSLRLRLVSEHGDQGFPGRLDVTLDVALTDDDRLVIDERATTDRPTVLSLALHPYFDLRVDHAGSVLDHELTLAAARYTPTDAELIPRGPAAPVAGTRFDFRMRRPIGSADYDVNFALDPPHAIERRAAVLRDPRSGRRLELFTTKPALQLYTGDARGVCVEAQSTFPDAPNRPDFPPAALCPGDVYRHRTVFAFSNGVDR